MTARPAGPALTFQPGKPVGNIYCGTCSWTDRTLIGAGTFYPATVRTAADRLRYYASQLPIVEVDATYYALPSERNAHLWVERTPAGFMFNIKAFGLFTHHPVVVERLPAAVKELLAADVADKTRIYLRDVPKEAKTLIWEMQAQALAPLAAAGKLGCVLFQFPHWFTARRTHIRYLQQLRDRSDWPIAAEFRGGGWMTDTTGPRRSLSSHGSASPTSSSTSRRGFARRRRRWSLQPALLPSSASTATTSRPTRSRTSCCRALPLPVRGGGVEELGGADPRPR